MGERGPFLFSALCERDDQRWIEAYSTGGGGFVVLSLTDRVSDVLPGRYVPRPYRVAGPARHGRAVAVDAEDIEPGGARRPDRAGRRRAAAAAKERRTARSRRGAPASPQAAGEGVPCVIDQGSEAGFMGAPVGSGDSIGQSAE